MFAFAESSYARLRKDELPSVMAKRTRQTMTPLEKRFFTEIKNRLPKTHWRRYTPISIPGDRELGPSVWYAPLYCHRAKLIVIVESRADFPYAISGQNGNLFTRFGYTVLDFTEDFSIPSDDSVYQDALQVVGFTLRPHP